MHVSRGRPPWSARQAPWFSRNPLAALAVSTALFVVIFLLRMLVGGATDAISLLYVFPIGLVAMAWGRLGGVLAGTVAVLLVIAWVVVRDIDLSVLGWASRLLPLLLVGAVLGDASERIADAAADREAQKIALERQREAVEINDTLVQGMSAAKWSIEAGRTEAGLKTLEDTVSLGHQLVSKLIRDSNAGFGRGSADSAED